MAIFFSLNQQVQKVYQIWRYQGKQIHFQQRQHCHFFFFPFWKGVYSKRKEFAPKGSKFFPFRVEPFSEGDWTSRMQIGSHKIVSLLKNGSNSNRCIRRIPVITWYKLHKSVNKLRCSATDCYGIVNTCFIETNVSECLHSNIAKW